MWTGLEESPVDVVVVVIVAAAAAAAAVATQTRRPQMKLKRCARIRRQTFGPAQLPEDSIHHNLILIISWRRRCCCLRC